MIMLILIDFSIYASYASTDQLLESNNIFKTDLEMIKEPNELLRGFYPEQPGIGGRTYYIKNMLTGQYLDVQNGTAGNGTNVWQYTFNGSLAQQWYLYSYGNGDYSLLSPVGNNGTYRFALDISNGKNENGANAQIWSIVDTDAQKFSIGKTTYGTYVLFTKCSNYEKAIVVNGPTCDVGRNVDQYTFQKHINEIWILEPVNRDVDKGIDYAKTNYQQYTHAYPNLTNFEGSTADCANFASQCLLSSGIHYDGDWRVYRKNFNYSQPTNAGELDNTWDLCQPRTSPWISAKQFGDYWRTKTTPGVYDANYILNHPGEIFSKIYQKGDIIQIAKNNFGFVAESEHTMFISDYTTYNGITNFALTYHSNSAKDKNLIQICEEYKNQGKNPYFVFFKI